MSDIDTNRRAASNLDELIAMAVSLRDAKRRSILGIAGPPGAGKTTFAEKLVTHLNAMQGRQRTTTLLPMDGYHHTNAWLDERGLQAVKGAPETFDVASYIELLRNVRDRPAQTWSAPRFNRVINEPEPNGYHITPEVRLVITDGNYLLLPGEWSAIKQICDEVWMLEIDMNRERDRLIARHVYEEGKTPKAAIEFVDRSDLANARRIVNESTEPTLVISLEEEPDLSQTVEE